MAFTHKKFKTAQLELAQAVSLSPLNRNIKTIAGMDVSFERFSHQLFAGIVVMEYETLDVIEEVGGMLEVDVPYVPGFLSFRELPPLLAQWKKLRCKPDVVMLDGHGILHPRRLGIASHFAVETGTPALGCAKSLLVGNYQPPSQTVGSHTEIFVEEEHRGYALRSKKNCNEIFISPGSHLSINDALEITQHCLKKYKLPEPTRRAHNYVNRIRKEFQA